MFRFESPFALLLLIFLPLFFEFGFLPRLRRLLPLKKKDETAASFSTPVPLSELPSSLRSRLRTPLLSLLFAATFASLVIALARPQFGSRFTESLASGRDIILEVDTSGSMRAVDFFIDEQRVDRLSALKYVVEKFIDQRRGDRMGLVVFGSQVFTQCPLTLDHDVLKDFLKNLEIGMAGPETAIGDAIAIGLKRIQDIESKSKTIILVTDGQETAGILNAMEAARAAAKLGVKIHTVGIGKSGPAPFVEDTIFGRQLVNRTVMYDEKTLKAIAELTGGEYFNAVDLNGLERVYVQIDKLEERQDKTFEYVEYDEKFESWVTFALILFLVYQLLNATTFLKIP